MPILRTVTVKQNPNKRTATTTTTTPTTVAATIATTMTIVVLTKLLENEKGNKMITTFYFRQVFAFTSHVSSELYTIVKGSLFGPLPPPQCTINPLTVWCAPHRVSIVRCNEISQKAALGEGAVTGEEA